MLEILQRVWENLIERTEGPLNLRFFIQPTVSIIFAIRAALRDVKSDTVPYLMRLFSSKKTGRKDIALEAWKDVGKVFIIGTVLDITYQLVLIFGRKSEHMFYPLESLIVAFGLAMLPYLLLRGPINRLIKLFSKKKVDSREN